MSEEFVSYVGEPDIHDGHVVAVTRDGPAARVEVRGASGRRYAVSFTGVESMSQRRPEGMRLYSLTEMRARPPLRQFVFTNGDEEDDAALELDAIDFACVPLPD